VVNVSSLTAIMAAPAMSLYCAGKSARDMFHLVLAEEQRKKWGSTTAEARREIRVLNYAPGPLDTDMQSAIRAAEAANASLGRAYTDMKENGQLVDMDKSAEKLVKLVRTKGAFVSGAHVDYYDETSALL
jgi:sepiapterin reductase